MCCTKHCKHPKSLPTVKVCQPFFVVDRFNVLNAPALTRGVYSKQDRRYKNMRYSPTSYRKCLIKGSIFSEV